MEKDNVAFRKRFGGYNKKDVNKYIISENEKFIREKEDLRAELVEAKNTASYLEAELSGLRDECEELRSECSVLRESLSESESLVTIYKEDIEKKDAEIAKLNEVINQKEKEDSELFSGKVKEIENSFKAAQSARVKELESIVSELKRQIEIGAANASSDGIFSSLNDDAFVPDDEEEKDKVYESLNREIDKILSYAREDASKIITAAEDGARQIRSGSSDVRSMKQDIAAKSSSIISEIKRRIKGLR